MNIIGITTFQGHPNNFWGNRENSRNLKSRTNRNECYHQHQNRIPLSTPDYPLFEGKPKKCEPIQRHQSVTQKLDGRDKG